MEPRILRLLPTLSSSAKWHCDAAGRRFSQCGPQTTIIVTWQLVRATKIYSFVGTVKSETLRVGTGNLF